MVYNWRNSVAVSGTKLGKCTDKETLHNILLFAKL